MQKITFATNTGVNTLDYVKLLLQSLRTNLDSDEHQILVFVDADNENTVEYLLSIKDTFKDLTIIENKMGFPTGYQRNTTLIAEYAKYDIISYLQSDMVIGPHYDTEVLAQTQKGRILSSTRVEPPLHGPSPVTFTVDLGVDPTKFDMDKWNALSPTLKSDKTADYFFAPLTYYKEDWLSLGGYDTTFRRSREDSDFVQRCLHANIELVQTFSANVYHFSCVSSRGKDWFNASNASANERVKMQNSADVIELRRFVRKWGNFNHGEQKLYKYDMDFVAKNGTDPYLLARVEPFFSRVWLDTDEIKDTMLKQSHTEHALANKLFGVSDSMWERFRHLFRQDCFENIYCVGVPTEYHIKVTADFSNIIALSNLLSNLHNMYDIFKDCDPGEYEMGGVMVSIKELKVLVPSTRTENPPFDHTLLTVH